ncbi:MULTISPECIES: nucleoside hydrolase [Brevibacillus]|uniref:nucleoside hydrolase n=1 Tax=Brevibacillus TaxID=55080 RepID=UPI00203D74D1|nr:MULTISPECIES: nucleoside hydrolase [Brevibacillus]MCM3077675.1 nucleoside hydrolase [Brevibacillus invocatus]MCM3428677.1 nucleoside hydrolase [Brevibacillus invocatus]MDH4617435.1 nucleoside hydrolase [Brevibacillus sp. AY1]
MKKIVLDVDTGVDDALGIMLAVKSGRFNLLGITTVNGNVSLSKATENTCKILDFLQVEQEIPVVRGASRPLLRHVYFEHRIHGEDGLGGALRDVQVRTEVKEGFGPDFMIEQVKKHPGEVTLIMTGPLTNLALAVSQYPELVDQVKEVIFMGGVVKEHGNVTPTAEYNMYVDPEAAKIVFHAGFPSLTLVGLDVTRKVLLNEAHIQELGDTPMAEYVKQSTSEYTQRYFQRNGVRACALHDPLAVAVAMSPELVTTRKLYVDIETRSELCDGQTVCDFQNRLMKEPNMQVCLDVDAPAFFEQFIRVLKA